MALAVGEVVDHYRIDEVIAYGAVTVVYSAFDLRLQRRVAFKVLGAGVARDAGFRARFARESTIAAQLGEHPHIVTVFDSNAIDGSLYFVTQFIEGMSLRDLIRSRPPRRPLGPAVALRFLDQIASALDYAHRHGAVHREVSPANIMITTRDESPSAYLVDFGITKRLEPADGEPVQGMFAGMGGYTVAEPGGTSTSRDRGDDVHALVCTAFEMLTGHHPYGSTANANQGSGHPAPIPSPTALQPQLPAAVDDVFARALDGGQDDHDATCDGFVRELLAAFPDGSLVESSSVGDDPASELSAPAPRSRSRAAFQPRLASVAVGIAVLLVLSVVAGWLISSGAGGGHPVPRADAGAASTRPAVSSTVARVTLATTTPSPTTPSPTTAAAVTSASGTIRRSAATPTIGAATRTVEAAPSSGPSPVAKETVLSTVLPTTLPPATAPPTTALGPFGDVIGQPVTQPASPQAGFALALQARQSPSTIAEPDTPAWFYAEWLRLVANAPTSPVTASNDGYVVDANGPAEVSGFQVGGDGKIVTLTECASDCKAVSSAIQISPNCAPGPGCAAFATDNRRLIVVLRATVNLRTPIATLLFSVRSTAQPVVAVSDANGTVRYDGVEKYFSITLPAGPPAGTESVVTVRFLDGSTSKLTVTYG